MARVRGRRGTGRPARPCAQGCVSGAPVAAGIHTKRGWRATTACLAGGQDSAAGGDGHDSGTAPRDGVPRVQLRFPAGAHDALDAVTVERRKVNWIVDARGFFDTIPRDWLIMLLEHRIGDRRVLIRKWLNAGAMERHRCWIASGCHCQPLRTCFCTTCLICGFTRHGARRFRMVKRSLSGTISWSGCSTSGMRSNTFAMFGRGRFGLDLHPDNRRVRPVRHGEPPEAPGGFDFPGFRHFCTKTRAGRFRLGRKTGRKDLHRGGAPQTMASRHMGGRRVCQGWLDYFVVPGRWLCTFRQRLQRRWMRAIRRRSQRHRFNWKRLERMTKLPWPPIRYPWLNRRFTVKHPRPDGLASKSGSVREVRSNAHSYRDGTGRHRRRQRLPPGTRDEETAACHRVDKSASRTLNEADRRAQALPDHPDPGGEGTA